MADGAGEKVSYWREITLVYPDEEITVVLPAPIITRLQEGDMKLMADIKKNIKETGVPLPADCSEKMSTQSIENVVDDLDHACPQTPMPSPESGSEPSTSSEKELPKVWNKKETQLLFHARMKLEKEFSEARSHKTLWDKIAKELKSAGCLVTARQCENKYKSLKREYRATIDHNSRSGNDRKSCAFFEEFSELYGMKAGSRPKFTIGSFSGSDRSQMQESFSSSDEQLPSSKEKHTRNKKDVQKRKTDGVTEWLQQYEERQVEFQRNKLEKIKEMHDEKMQMMGKLLNALEKKNN